MWTHQESESASDGEIERGGRERDSEGEMEREGERRREKRREKERAKGREETPTTWREKGEQKQWRMCGGEGAGAGIDGIKESASRRTHLSRPPLLLLRSTSCRGLFSCARSCVRLGSRQSCTLRRRRLRHFPRRLRFGCLARLIAASRETNDAFCRQ